MSHLDALRDSFRDGVPTVRRFALVEDDDTVIECVAFSSDAERIATDTGVMIVDLAGRHDGEPLTHLYR